MRKVLAFLKNTFYPLFCLYCKEFLSEDTVLCSSCLELISPIATCRLKITQTYEVQVFAVGAYKDPLRSVIYAKQYGSKKSLEGLGDLLWNHTDLKNVPFDCIVPVPLHSRKYARRWFNQAEVIAQKISKHSNKPVIGCIKKLRETQSQMELSRKERLDNVKNVFYSVPMGGIKDKHVLIIDDVMTTGSTMKEAIRALRVLKPGSITVAVLCRVI